MLGKFSRAIAKENLGKWKIFIGKVGKTFVEFFRWDERKFRKISTGKAGETLVQFPRGIGKRETPENKK